MARFDELTEGELGMGVGDDHFGVQLCAVCERHAGSPSFLDQDAPYAGAGADLRTVFAGVGGNSFRDCPRAAPDEGPFSHLAVDLSDVVMEEDVGGAGCVRATVCPYR